MARTVSTALKNEIFQRMSSDTFIVLLTITGDDIPSPIRLSADMTERITDTQDEIEYGTISRGDNYRYMPFSLGFPRDVDGEAPRAKIRVDNVSRELVDELRSIRQPLVVSIETVLKNSPDTVDITLPDFQLRDITANELHIEGELRIDNLADEAYPATRFTTATAPAAFQGV